MIELDRSEAIRYMGYHGTQPDEAVQASLTRCGEALQQVAEPKSIYRVFPLQHIDAQTLEIADVQIHSKNLARNLQGCSEVCLMAATLGIGPDRLIARASAVRMSDAVIYQAAAAAMVETYCDEVNERIRQDAAQRGMYCRPRFSPGYGDFPIAHQRDFSRLLDTPRKIGLTVTESCLKHRSRVTARAVRNAARRIALTGDEKNETDRTTGKRMDIFRWRHGHHPAGARLKSR